LEAFAKITYKHETKYTYIIQNIGTKKKDKPLIEVEKNFTLN